MAVRLVERLAGSRPLRLARVLETPRDKCLAEPAPDEESAERKRLRLGRLSHSELQLTCCRNPGKKLLEIASVAQPELLVVALSRPADEPHQAILRWILKESKFDLLLIDVGGAIDPATPIPSRLVIPVTAGQVWPRQVLAEAARLVGPHGSIEVVGMMIVPRSLALDAPLADDEATLNAVVRDTTLGVTLSGGQAGNRILRARDRHEALGRLRNESLPGTMVLEWSDASSSEGASLLDIGSSGTGIALVRQTRQKP
jgi:hypothetical protein